MFTVLDSMEDWAMVFHAICHREQADPRMFNEEGQLSFMDWATEQFGPCDHTYDAYRTDRWSCIAGGLNCYVMFKDLNDAMLFKLTWG